MLHDTTMYDHILEVLEGECQRAVVMCQQVTHRHNLKTTTLFLVAKEKTCRVERKY